MILSKVIADSDRNHSMARLRALLSFALFFFGLTPVASQCFDNHQLCQFWSSIGECRNNPVWMLPNCAFSCNNCRQPDYNSYDYYNNNNNNNNDYQQFPDYQQSIDSQPNFQQPQPPPPVQQQPSGNSRSTCESLLRSGASDTATRVLNEHLANPTETNRGLSLADINNSNERSFCVPTTTSADCTSNPCFHASFRTMDGSCNNLQDPLRGASFQSHMRLMGVTFDDGVNAPRGAFSNMPSPRDIVMNVVRSTGIVDHPGTNMLVMQWGQFIAHDIVKTTILPENNCRSCVSDNQCLAIPVNPFDPSSTTFGCDLPQRCCVRMSRTTPVCGTGQGGRMRQQINENTAYIDGSGIYGSSVADMRRLRDGNTPFLRSHFERGFAWPLKNNRNQFTAGDERINIFVGLVAYHTIFFREHNRVARNLQQVNPQWNGDRVYHEARKIVGAELQAITYKEWLPIILGSGLGGYPGYDPSADASVSLEFSTGIFRFGHGMIREFFPRLNPDGSSIPAGNLQFLRGINNPDIIMFEGGTDALIRGMASTSTKMPQRVTSSVTDRIFGNKDLASINIERGRDNGISSYNSIREFCGLGRVNSFDEIPTDPQSRQNLQQQYASTDQIDVWAAAIVENPVAGGLVGPTMACVIRNQFTRTRSADRFWYQKPGVFTPAQLAAIETTSFARVLCDNGENLGSIPSRAFNLDAPVSCNNIPGIDFSAWRES